jgi:hypothetical protein
MFDFNKLGDLSKMAQSAKQIQEKQDRLQREQIDLLHKISSQLQEVILLLKKR